MIVNVQGDLPTIDPAAIAASIGPLRDPAVDIATLVAEITREEEKTEPSVVKMIGSKSPRAISARSISRARRRRAGKGLSIIISGSTPIAGGRLSGSSACRRRRSSGASDWSSCGRSRRACGSTRSSSTTCRSASTRLTTSSARARSSPPGEADDDNQFHSRASLAPILTSLARRCIRVGNRCHGRHSRTPSRPSRRARRALP